MKKTRNVPDSAESAGKPFEWTATKERAAAMLAEGTRSINEIAGELGISEKTVDRWKEAPEFRERIDAIVNAYRERFLKQGLARKERRLAALDDLYVRQMRVVTERASSKELGDIPGGPSGLVVVRWKSIGFGEDAQFVREHEADVGLSKEIRSTLQQVAQEVGEWSEKRELTGKNGGPIEVKHDITPAVSAYLAELRAWRGAPAEKQG